MAFITTTHPQQAQGEVAQMYARQQRKFGYVPNYAKLFSHRPQLMQQWAQLLDGIKQPTDQKRFELVTLAAARALRNSYCSLAHAKALGELIPESDVDTLFAGEDADAAQPTAQLTASDLAITDFASKAAAEPSKITAGDVEVLKAHGLSDAEIFDIAATVAARAFFTTLLDILGAEADAPFKDMDEARKKALVVGRPIGFEPPQRVPEKLSATSSRQGLQQHTGS